MLQLLYKNSQSGRDLYRKLKELGVPVSRKQGNKRVSWNVSDDREGTLNGTCIGKLTQLRRMKDAEVQTIPFWTDLRDALRECESVFSRLPDHQEGRDIIRYDRNSRHRPRPHEYFTKLLPKEAEYRIHVFNGLAVRCGKKIPPEGVRVDPLSVWNTNNNWSVMYEFHDQIPRAVKDLAKKAVEVVDYDFGAVDIISSRVNRSLQHFVLEVNKAPNLYKNTLEKYAQKIKTWYEEN